MGVLKFVGKVFAMLLLANDTVEISVDRPGDEPIDPWKVWE
jgi:hypothetical protein